MVQEKTYTKEDAKKWIEEGGKCIYQYGWGWKGASYKYITKEEALEKLPNYSFGKNFYELDFTTVSGEKVLRFNELSENDMW